MKKLLLLIPAFLLLCFAAAGQTTYTWTGASGASWQVATNWTPERTTPATNDVLQFNDGFTKTVTAVPTQTVGRLLVTANTNITLQAADVDTLTISGGVGVDLEVGAGSQLNVSGASALLISLSTGATGSISGSITFTGGVHRLLARATNAVIFNSGASFTAGTGFTGSAFGEVVAHTNSIVFSSGSTYTHVAGSNPFALGGSASVVVFQTGSLYRHTGTGSPAFSGRTYANFELNFSGTIGVSGTSSVSVDNLTITQGILNFGMTGTPGHSIKGNITVASGATLNFNPGSAGTVNLNGAALQIIAGGGTISATTLSTLATSNTSGVRLDKSAQLNNLTVGLGGSLVVAPAAALTVTGTLTNNAGVGGLVLRSGASMIHNTTGVPATMERFFSGTALWRLVASPVANQAIDAPWMPVSPNHGYDIYAWHEPTSTWRNQKVAANSITHFLPGRGYLVSFQAAGLTQGFAGPLNNGNVVVPVVRENPGAFRGANLLGNPYPSSIDWNLADRTLFADDFAYIYDPILGGGGSYVPVNGAVAGARIAPNQGFFVIKSTAVPADFTFTNAMRTHGGVFKSAPADPAITITLQQGEFYDRAQIVQLQDATTARERSDALKFFSYNPMMPQVFSLSSDAVQLAVNSTGPISEDASFAIGVLTPSTGTYTLRVDGLQEILAGRPAFLLDKVTGASHNLRTQSHISFHAVQSSTAIDRFVLNFVQPTGVGNNLPVDATLVYFANGMLHIQFPAEESNRQLQVIDLSGRVVFSKRLQGMDSAVSVPLYLDNGAYIVRITGDTSAVNRRIWVR